MQGRNLNINTVFQYIFACACLFTVIGDAIAEYSIPERRKDQFPDTPAHLVVPLPYSYPGIGEGAFLLGNFSNVMETNTDVLVMKVTGDAGGNIFQLDEIPLIDRNLYLKLYYQDIDRAVVNQYDQRGMDGTNKNDYTLLDASLALTRTAELTMTFLERRLNFNYQYNSNEFELQAIRNYKGDLIVDLEEPYRGKGYSDSYNMSLDLTDDYLDPRQGMSFKLNYTDRPAETSQDPSFYVLTSDFLYYLPMFESDTLVFNYFQSDAHVSKIGNVNPDDIRKQLGLNCSPIDSVCLGSETNLVETFINDRTNGSSASLGGKERLRSYPEGRFQGGHSAFIGAEYRWNFVNEVQPFNYKFWKDVRTGLQLAFFAELGTVSETSAELWDESRYSYGTGFRLVAASGAVYRADIAMGDEGSELTVFFFYPW